MTYLTPLDGMRALAVIAVILYHISPVTLRGGFTGVDIFFVLSGFIISCRILNDLKEGSFSFLEFYQRRVQRILPNVIVLVLTVVLLWVSFFQPGTSQSVGLHGLWTLFNVSNIFVWKNLGGYWGASAEWAPLTHTWSLGIEEQFYLCFPLFLFVLFRLQPKRIRLCLIMTTVLFFGLSLYGSYVAPLKTFYLLPTRVWEFLLGATLATYQMPIRNFEEERFSFLKKHSNIFGWLGICLIFIGFLISGETAFPGWICIPPTIGTALVILSVLENKTLLSRWLSLPLMVSIGKLSYSLYLWHWPLIIFGKLQALEHGLPKISGAIAGGFLGILFALLSYFFVERPFRKRGFGRTRRVLTIGIGFVFAALVSGYVGFRPQIKNKYALFDTPTSSMRKFEVGRELLYPKWTSSSLVNDVLSYPAPPRTQDPWRKGGIIHLFGGEPPTVMLLGSSQALMYANLIDDICRKLDHSVAFLASAYGSTAFFETRPGPNFPADELAEEFDEARKYYLQKWRPKAVFIIDGWASRGTSPQNFKEKLELFLTEISPLVGRIYLVSQIPILERSEINLREIVQSHFTKNKSLPNLYPNSGDTYRKKYMAQAESLKSKFPNFRVLRVEKFFLKEDGSVRYSIGRKFLYADHSHLTDEGANVVRSAFEEAIIEAHSSERQIK